MATAVRAKLVRATDDPEHQPGDCITAGTKPVCDECLDLLPEHEYEPVPKARAKKAKTTPALPDRFSLAAAIVDADLVAELPAEPLSPEYLDELDVATYEHELKVRETPALESVESLFESDTCSLCGLTFPGGVRTFKAWGSPTRTKADHFEHHRAEAEARSRDPLTTYGTGVKGRVAVPEDPAHFPVYVNGELEFPTLPVTAKQLERHIKRYGSEGTKEVKTVDRLTETKRRTARSPMRKRVLELHEQGFTTLAISKELCIKTNTVERYVREERKRAA
jgi:hypothetical protein